MKTYGLTIDTDGIVRNCIGVGVEHGPIAVPWRNLHGKDEGGPNYPALYGRYIALDLDANNRASRDEFRKRTGHEPRSFGWGVCRHGFGLQEFGDGTMSQEVAEARAIALNRGRMASDIPNA